MQIVYFKYVISNWIIYICARILSGFYHSITLVAVNVAFCSALIELLKSANALHLSYWASKPVDHWSRIKCRDVIVIKSRLFSHIVDFLD